MQCFVGVSINSILKKYIDIYVAVSFEYTLFCHISSVNTLHTLNQLRISMQYGFGTQLKSSAVLAALRLYFGTAVL